MRTDIDIKLKFIKARAHSDKPLYQIAEELGICRQTASKWNVDYSDQITAISSGKVADLLFDGQTQRQALAGTIVTLGQELSGRNLNEISTNSILGSYLRALGLLEKLDRATDDDDLSDLFANLLPERKPKNDSTNRREHPRTLD